MDEAELAQILGEAFRIYGSELKQGVRVHEQFKPLLEGKHATVTIKLTKNHVIELIAPQETTTTMSNTNTSTPDLPMIEPIEEKPKAKKKEKTTAIEDNHSER